MRFLDFVRQTHTWSLLRDWRYLQRHRERRNFYRQFVPRGGLVVDIGANVGHYTLFFHSLGARVLAVEPQSALVTQLRRRFAGRRNIEIIQTALGAAPGTAVLHKAPGLTEVASLRADIAQRSRFAQSHPFSETETVPVVTLDNLLATRVPPDFCKIDVEGFELAVLSGLSRPVRAISLEFNREFWPDTLKCLERLGEIADYRFNYAVGESNNLATPRWLTADRVVAALDAHSDPLLWGDIYARVAPPDASGPSACPS